MLTHHLADRVSTILACFCLFFPVIHRRALGTHMRRLGSCRLPQKHPERLESETQGADKEYHNLSARATALFTSS